MHFHAKWTAGKKMRSSMGPHPLPRLECEEIPAQVMRQPFPKLEAGLAPGPVTPVGWDFRDAIACKKSLHRQFQVEFKASLALDVHRLQHTAIVNLEGIRGVMRGYAAKCVKAHPGHARE